MSGRINLFWITIIICTKPQLAFFIFDIALIVAMEKTPLPLKEPECSTTAIVSYQELVPLASL